MLTEWSRLLRPVARRLAALVTRGAVSRVTMTTKTQTLQVQGLPDEVLDKVEHFQPYGFTAAPVAGAECLVVAPAGVRELAVVPVVSDPRHRPTTLVAGEVVLHTTDKQVVAHGRTDGSIDLGGSSGTVAAAKATTADQRFSDIEAKLNALITAFNAHVHSGVTTGPGSSGPTASTVTALAAGASTAAAKVRVK